MPAKLTTTINKIKTVPNPTNAEILDQFYLYMKGNDISENHQNNCLKVVIALANFLGTDVTFCDNVDVDYDTLMKILFELPNEGRLK
jgi:hypothetical protein